MCKVKYRKLSPLAIYYNEKVLADIEYGKILKKAQDKLRKVQLECKHPHDKLKQVHISWESAMQCEHCGALVDNLGAHEYYG